MRSHLSNTCTISQAAKERLAAALKESQAVGGARPSDPPPPHCCVRVRLSEPQAVAELEERAGKPSADVRAPTCERPEPPGQLPLPLAESRTPGLASELVQCWAFACAFSGRLTLTKFSVDNFVAALCRPGHGSVLAELHVRLLRALLADTERFRRPPAAGCRAVSGTCPGRVP